MNKSVYSLVLMDNVVSEVDKMAYEMGTSRSNLINQILAEYVRYTTPEMRMRAVFEEMERLMQGVDSFQIQPQPSDAMLTIRSALRYKYKPTIRYSVEHYFPRKPDKLIIGGGGSMNKTLVRAVDKALPECRVLTNEDLGYDSNAKEAVAFAVMANETIFAGCNNVPTVTGARNPVEIGRAHV